jgi:hypothetical protein
MRCYLLTNISRKPLIVLNRMLASALTSTTSVPGSIVVEEADLSDYDIVAYLRRGSIQLEELSEKGHKVEQASVEDAIEVRTEPEEVSIPEDVIDVDAEVTESSNEPTAEMYNKEDLKGLTSLELRSILSSLGVSSNARKKSKLIEKILEAQDV